MNIGLEGETKMIVTWKDEGTKGPCTSYENEDDMNMELEYGKPHPADTHHGWMTRSAAVKIAKDMGAEFRDV